MRLLIINGPNLNMLGIREPELYGKQDYKALVEFCMQVCEENGFECKIYQSNHEGDLVDKIQGAYGVVDGIIINAAAYTHTSVAILDALKAVGLPAVEVHLTDIGAREDFRKLSYPGMACIKTFAGFGFEGYAMAVRELKEVLSK